MEYFPILLFLYDWTFWFSFMLYRKEGHVTRKLVSQPGSLELIERKATTCTFNRMELESNEISGTELKNLLNQSTHSYQAVLLSWNRNVLYAALCQWWRQAIFWLLQWAKKPSPLSVYDCGHISHRSCVFVFLSLFL